MNTLRIEKRGSLAVLRLDKPRGNAIDEALVADLTTALAEIDRDGTVAGVLMASAHPKLFCPGLDLVGLLEYDRPALKTFMERFAAAVWALYGLRKPMVAAVGGHAIAGGCVLALTADWRVLQRGGINIGLNEVRVGVPLPWSVALLLRASVRPEALAEVALLGRNFADEEALAVGLVHELAPAAGFEEACLARLAEFVEKDAAAISTTKVYLRADALREMKAHEAGLAEDFLDSWFSEGTRTRIQATVQSLGKSKG